MALAMEDVCITGVEEPPGDVCIVAVDAPKEVCIVSEEKEVELVYLHSRGKSRGSRSRTPDVVLTNGAPLEPSNKKSRLNGNEGSGSSLPMVQQSKVSDQPGPSYSPLEPQPAVDPGPTPTRPGTTLQKQGGKGKKPSADSLPQGIQPLKSKPSISAQTQDNSHPTNTSQSITTKCTTDSVKERPPTCWTVCPRCPPINNKTYHLIDISPSSKEAEFVCQPLTRISFEVVKVQRVQNELLWERLMAEKKLMLKTRDFVNMQFLYHTTSAEASVICEEGLDLRLSRQGSFGNGIYFSDMPIKCNSYWRKNSRIREMFVCRVLLGNCKEFPPGRCAPTLVREPAISKPKAGKPKTYDSVKGCINGLNEFVVYNTYRVMPEYLIHYTVLH